MRFPMILSVRALRDDQVDRLEVEVWQHMYGLILIARGLIQSNQNMKCEVLRFDRYSFE